MAAIRRLVLDVLKPHDPPVTDLATRVADTDGVSGTNVALVEIDRKVTNVKLTIEGSAIDFDRVTAVVERHGGTVHSIDEVACGEELIEMGETPQD